MEQPKEFYRYADRLTTSGPKIYEQVFDLVRATPKGYWVAERLGPGQGKQRWTSAKAKRRLCYPTRDEAFASYVARKSRQVLILQSRLANALSLRNAAQHASAVHEGRPTDIHLRSTYQTLQRLKEVTAT